MFSLEEISKIKNAKTSKEVMQFFKVLDKYIPDNFRESNQNISHTHNIKNKKIRKDKNEQFDPNILQKNFPVTQSGQAKL